MTIMVEYFQCQVTFMLERKCKRELLEESKLLSSRRPLLLLPKRTFDRDIDGEHEVLPIRSRYAVPVFM